MDHDLLTISIYDQRFLENTKKPQIDISKLPCNSCEWRYSIHCPKCEWNKKGKVKVY